MPPKKRCGTGRSKYCDERVVSEMPWERRVIDHSVDERVRTRCITDEKFAEPLAVGPTDGWMRPEFRDEGGEVHAVLERPVVDPLEDRPILQHVVRGSRECLRSFGICDEIALMQ